MRVNITCATPFIHVKSTQLKIDAKKSSFWQEYKFKILSVATVLAICSIAAASMKWYDKAYWIYGYDGGKCPAPNPSDEFNRYRCINGEWDGFGPIPIENFNKRAEACALGEKITGCINGKYFHHLSTECEKNLKGVFCKYTTAYEDPFKKFKKKSLTF